MAPHEQTHGSLSPLPAMTTSTVSTLSPPPCAADGCNQDCVCDMGVLSLVLGKTFCSFARGQAETEPVLEEPHVST